ncbi:MAG: 2-methylisocitrate lyase-like PEP mutase family enzyme [Parasphingorhabdus sp.]|jgi:2-methylisocitrate lyase-like PEP mutase family enzyme
MYQKAEQFLELHSSGKTFVMPNAWNAGSAMVLVEAGFTSIATTSAGIAFSKGLPDYQNKLSFDDALLETRRIAAAVDVPVSMDSENCYGDSAQAVYDNMIKIAATGVVGASIEDHEPNSSEPLYEFELAVERVQAAREALNGLDYPFVLTARAECYLVGHASPLEESIRRVNSYREAGADCLYIPGVRDIQTIATLVKEVNGPLNVVMGLSGPPLTVAELADVGVARISIGGSLARATLGLVRKAADEILNQGVFNYAAGQIPDAELCELFAEKSSNVR